MPRASSPPGAGLRKVRRRKSSGYANPREQAMYGGSRKSRVVKAAKVEKSLRTGRRTAAVQAYKSHGPSGVTAKQEAIALRTMARRASTPQEWRQLQVKSPTKQALPGLETNIKQRRSQEVFDALPRPVQSVLKAEADAVFATKVFKYARTLPDFPKPELQRLRKVAFNKRQNAQGMKLRLAEGSADINAKSPLIGLDKRGNINRIGPDPRLDGNSIENIVGDLIPDQPWEIALVVGTGASGNVVKAGAQGAVAGVKAARAATRASRFGKAAGRVGKVRRATVAAVGSRTGATAARNAARQAAARATAGVPAAVKTGAKRGAKIASAPVRNPGKTVVATSGANIYSQTAGGTPIPKATVRPQEGIFTALANPAVKAAPGKIAENFLKDLVDLPVNLIPSLFLAGKASVEFAKGDPEELNAMVADYIETGFLPNAVKGDWKAAGEAFVNHPLYVALGASGGYAFIGRGARELLARPAAAVETFSKKGSRPHKVSRKVFDVVSEKRPNLKLNRNKLEAEQRYSKNLLTKYLLQRPMEKRIAKQGKDPHYWKNRPGVGSFKVGMGGIGSEKRKYLRGAQEVAKHEGARRIEMSDAPLPLYRENRNLLTKLASGVNQRIGLDIPKSIKVPVIFMNGMIRRPETAREDLALVERMWEDAYRADQAEKRANPKAGWRPSDIRTNRKLVEGVRKTLRDATDEDIARIFEVKDRYLKKDQEQQAAAIRGDILDKEQVEAATASPYATVHMGGRPVQRWKIRGVKKTFETQKEAKAYAKQRKIQHSPRPIDVYMDADGNFFDRRKVKQQMQKEGVEAAFVTERPNFTGLRANFYQVTSVLRGRTDRPGETRTGKAEARGTFDAGVEVLREQLISMANVLNRAEGVDAINRAGLAASAKSGEIITENSWAAADLLVDRNGKATPEGIKRGLDPDETFEAVNISKTRGGQNTVAQDEAWRMLNEPVSTMDISDQPSLIADEQLRRARDRSLPGKIGFLPRAYLRQVEELAKPQVGYQKFFSAWSNLFKGVILPLSPKWIVGNVVDPTFRSILAGIGPQHWLIAYHLLKEIAKDNPRLRRELDTVLVGGTMAGTARTQAIRRGQPEQWEGSPLLSKFFKVWYTGRNFPVLKQISDGYALFRNLSFEVNGTFVEGAFQRGAIGKEAYRRMREMNYTMRDAMKPGGEAYRDLAKGMTSSAAQMAYAQEVWKVFGRWNTLTRGEKDILSYMVPFGLWLKASTQFVAITLPRHHPIKVAIGTQIAQMTEEERKQLGLSMFSDRPVQFYNMGSIPLTDDKWYRPQFATSFGMFADPTNIVANNLFSQYSFLAEGLAGVDWNGNKLVSSDGSPLRADQKAALALASLFEVSVPFVMQVGRLAGWSLADQIAKPSWAVGSNYEQDPFNERLLSWLGGSTMSKEDIANSRKYFDTIDIQVPRNGTSSSEKDDEDKWNYYFNK